MPDRFGHVLSVDSNGGRLRIGVDGQLSVASQPRDCGLIGAVQPLLEDKPGNSPIHRASVEECQVEPTSDPRAVVDLPEPLGPSIAMTSGRQPSPITTPACPSDTCTPYRAQDRPMPGSNGQTTVQPRLVISSVKSSARSGVTDSARYPSWRIWSCSIEMSSTLTPAAPTSENKRPNAPGWSGISTTTWLYATGRAPCLPGIFCVPATARSSWSRRDAERGTASTAWIRAASSSRT